MFDDPAALSRCVPGDKCHRAGLQAPSSHGLSGRAAPAHAGLLAEGQERTAQIPRYCQHVGQNDTQPCVAQGRDQQCRPRVRGGTRLHIENTLSAFFKHPPVCPRFCCLQSSPSCLVRPRGSRPEQRELRGRLAGCVEDDPVSGLLPGLRLHFFAAGHTNDS